MFASLAQLRTRPYIHYAGVLTAVVNAGSIFIRKYRLVCFRDVFFSPRAVVFVQYDIKHRSSQSLSVRYASLYNALVPLYQVRMDSLYVTAPKPACLRACGHFGTTLK